jgi:hypothetical protein
VTFAFFAVKQSGAGTQIEKEELAILAQQNSPFRRIFSAV